MQLKRESNVLQKQLCGLLVPHEVQAQGAASLAALSALCMYLKRCHADKELATSTHKVITTVCLQPVSAGGLLQIHTRTYTYT